jgi:hypothetical protein
MGILSSYPNRKLTAVLGHDSANRVGRMQAPPVIRDLVSFYNATGDGVADDTAALNLAAADYNLGYSIIMPEGTFLTSTGITLNQATYHSQLWLGAGGTRSVIKMTGAGDAITIAGSTFTGVFRNFNIDTSTAAASGRGIYASSSTQIISSLFANMQITADGNAIDIANHTSHELNNVVVSSNKGHGFALAGGAAVLLSRCRVINILGSHKAAYRIGTHATMISCSGVTAADYWGVFGGRTAITGTAQTGSSTSTIKLAAGLTTTTDEFKGYNIRTTSGTGSGQTRLCTAINKSTKVANITPNWSVTPDATTTYSIEDSEAQFQATLVPDIIDIDNQVSTWSIDGIRFLSNQIYRRVGGVFTNAGSYQSSIHLYGGTESAGKVTTLIGVVVAPAGSRSGGQDILVDYQPSYISGNNVATGSGQLNIYYDVDAAGNKYFNNIHALGVHWPKLATADPADGTGAIWTDGADSHRLKQGT